MATPAKYAYVSYDLDFSIIVAQKLWDNRGDTPASNDEVAALLGYTSTNNGAYLTRIANAKSYGLIEGPSSALKVTPLAVKIIRPESDAAAMAARLEAFESVPLFKAFLTKYNGQPLPNQVGLTNVLETTFHQKKDKCAFVLKRLLDAADQAGLFQLSPDHSKMIRPTGHIKQVTSGGDGDDSGRVAAEQAATQRARDESNRDTPRTNKMIDGVLDQLPPESKGWSEDDLTTWLEFLELALRLYYGLPKARKGSTEGVNS